MADIAFPAGIAELRRHSRAATTEPDWLRIVMIAAVLAMLTLVLFAPLVAVFSEALAKGFAEAVASFSNPDVLSAIKLTLIVAAIAVPLNAAFGVAAAWAIAKFDFRGKAFLITFIDLPFSVSPVVAGLCFVLLFGAQGAGRLVPDRARRQDRLRRSRHHPRDDVRHLPLRRPRADPGDAGAGQAPRKKRR